MKLRNAMARSIRQFYNGELPKAAIENSEGEFKYTLEFFEKMKTAEPKKAKPGKKEASDEA